MAAMGGSAEQIIAEIEQRDVADWTRHSEVAMVRTLDDKERQSVDSTEAAAGEEAARHTGCTALSVHAARSAARAAMAQAASGRRRRRRARAAAELSGETARARLHRKVLTHASIYNRSPYHSYLRLNFEMSTRTMVPQSPMMMP